jgi:hypothetical protein
MSLERLPLDDLAVAKPVGSRALALVSDFTRFDPPDFGSPEPDHGVASCHEALREDAWLHVLISRFKPIAHLVVPAQPRPAWSLEHNLEIVQREKLVNVVPRIEQFDPSARDCDVLLRHVRTLSLRLAGLEGTYAVVSTALGLFTAGLRRHPAGILLSLSRRPPSRP